MRELDLTALATSDVVDKAAYFAAPWATEILDSY